MIFTVYFFVLHQNVVLIFSSPHLTEKQLSNTGSPRMTDSDPMSSPRMTDSGPMSSPRMTDSDPMSSPRMTDSDPMSSPRMTDSDPSRP